MITCKTCKHWEKYTGSEVSYFGDQAGICHSEKFKRREGQPLIDGLNFWDVSSDLNYWGDKEGEAGFNTGSNFGCIHWTEKTANQGDQE